MKYKVSHIHDTRMSTTIAEVGHEEGFSTVKEALEAAEKLLTSEIVKWRNEAFEAFQSDDLYRGGGILKLAETMRKLSAVRGQLAALGCQDKKSG